MPEFVGNCPRCRAKSITFDVLETVHIRDEYDWQRWYEVFCICRNCHHSTVFVLANAMYTDHDKVNKIGIMNIEGSLNHYFNDMGHISLKDEAAQAPPDHLPEQIEAVFKEAATCLAVNCWNAAGTMFRLCIDLATLPLLPEEDTDGFNRSTRRSLGLRLQWLFDKGMLPESLRELSACIKDDGNDAAHAGNLAKEDAEDLLDFTCAMLERLYTETGRLQLAKERRKERRK